MLQSWMGVAGSSDRKPHQGMKGDTTHQATAWFLAVAFSLGWSARAPAAAHLSVTQPGGMPGMPIVTGITRVTNGVNVTWDGPSGYYQLFQKRRLQDQAWQAVGTPFNLSRNETVTTLHSNAFFRVSGPAARYAGAQTCGECHGQVLHDVLHTAHAGTSIFTNSLWVAQGGQTNGSCLACHTVGYGLPTGFVSPTTTPHLAGVQCENCHGPAGNHASNPDDPTAVPRVEIAAAMCGGCHSAQFVPAGAAASHPPRYEEWNASPHQAVLEELKEDFASTPSLISTCGRCHSGSVRQALLKGQALPGAQEAGAVGIACATCHDPHQLRVFTNAVSGIITNPVTGQVFSNGPPNAVYASQVLNPLTSLQDYHTGGNFTTNYNPRINLCGQCHNDRGASYLDSARPPHHSPQYNLLLGTVGVVDTNTLGAPHFNPAAHAYATKQCVTCHMQVVSSPSPSQPGTAGHTFGKITSSANCGGGACHGAGDVANLLVPIVKQIITANPDGLFPVHSIAEVRSSLVQWANTKAPAILGTSAYGTNAWAYTNYSPGDPLAGGPGPSAALQQLIPRNIKIARFNLYLVQNDGSFGTHNFFYTVDLLNTAYDLVGAELAK
ncbi:MAG TPA: cytochrome c family protein [Candidatus Paceibacterota bacterium]|nr:cytochrome c family protein [Candidatus Paceibacterota bacterium]